MSSWWRLESWGPGIRSNILVYKKFTNGLINLINHWFPLIRPAIKPLFLGGLRWGEVSWPAIITSLGSKKPGDFPWIPPETRVSRYCGWFCCTSKISMLKKMCSAILTKLPSIFRVKINCYFEIMQPMVKALWNAPQNTPFICPSYPAIQNSDPWFGLLFTIKICTSPKIQDFLRLGKSYCL